MQDLLFLILLNINLVWDDILSLTICWGSLWILIFQNSAYQTLFLSVFVELISHLGHYVIDLITKLDEEVIWKKAKILFHPNKLQN